MITTVIQVEVEADCTVLADLEEIKFTDGTIGTEDESSAVAVDNLHLCLKDEVAKVTGIGGAGDEEMCTRSAHMVSISAESARASGTAPFIPAVAFAIITQGVIERQRPIAWWIRIRISGDNRGGSGGVGLNCGGECRSNRCSLMRCSRCSGIGGSNRRRSWRRGKFA